MNPLLYSGSSDPNMLYFGRVGMGDPFLAMGVRGKKYTVVNALEFSRVRRTSDFDVVLAQEDYLQRARKRWPRRPVGTAEVICLLWEELKRPRLSVVDGFSAGLFQRLRKLHVTVELATKPLFPEREIKTPAEAAAVKEGNRCSALGIAAAERILRQSRIRSGWLFHEGKRLTSERLQFAVEVACLEAGAVSASTIVAGGDQACDPHERGSGPLRAHELIVVDVFPRVKKTGYHGDMTRTFLRGRASAEQRALVSAVRLAQLAALRAIRTGVPGREVNAKVVDFFKAQGYETKRGKKGSVGFFHSTGHGLGLAVHEAPSLGGSATRPLQRGAVVTVEPGLYYPGLGGCRIEDVVQVTNSRPAMLSRYHYDWEFR